MFDDARRSKSRNRWRWAGLLFVVASLWGPAQARACGALNPGESLAPGQAVSTCNGRGQVIHQDDGNVVFYDQVGALWATGTNGNATSALIMQDDGNLVLYGPGNTPLWQTHTHGNPGAWLNVQDDCNLVIYSATQSPLWATNRLCRGAAPPSATNGASFVSQVVPSSLSPGQTATVSITLRNSGTSPWSPAGQYSLGSQSPQDNLTWGIGRVSVGETIVPTQQKTFTFTITAPSAPGTYAFQWRMVQDGVEWFGDFTAATPIQVASGGGDDNACTRTGRSGLSGVAAAVLSSIETNPRAIADSPVPLPRILSTCNRFVSVAIDGPAIFAAARDLIASAEHEVDMAFYVWEEGSHAVGLIGDGLIAAQARRTPSDPLLVRIVIDDVDSWLSPDRAVNHLWNSQKLWVSRGLDTSRVHLQFGTSPRATAAAANFHDKIIVVDGKYVLVTGANLEPAHDPGAPWHDTAYVFEGDAAQSALAAFEHTWTGDAFHWECKQEFLSHDCDKRPHYPQPARPWLPPFGSQRPGDLPILAVGRAKTGTFPIPENDTNNPQDIAWLRLMDRATSHIHVESPNINDDAFRAAVVRAVGRGVTVRLLVPLGFNDFAVDLPSQGGDNLEVVGNLRKEIRASFPANQTLFQLRWYSKDGIEPIAGNGESASHTKYMSVDDRVAVVGSGNMDTNSWNISHEFNLLIDDAPTVAQLEESLFLPDWNRAIGSYVELYEGNGGTQDVLCMIAVNQDKSLRFGDPILGTDYKCNNDEARSLLLHDVPAGKVLRFYDHPFRSESDDWVEIIVKRAVARKYISSFELSFEDADVRVIYHRYDGLDGKVSAADVATTSVSPPPPPDPPPPPPPPPPPSGGYNMQCFPSWNACTAVCRGVCERRINCGGPQAHKCFE